MAKKALLRIGRFFKLKNSHRFSVVALWQKLFYVFGSERHFLVGVFFIVFENKSEDDVYSLENVPFIKNISKIGSVEAEKKLLTRIGRTNNRKIRFWVLIHFWLELCSQWTDFAQFCSKLMKIITSSN